jgi:hypothetical protein
MKVFNCEQGSLDWFMIRKGRPTASCFHRIITRIKKKPAAGARAYAYELAAEAVRETPTDGSENYMTRAMIHGAETEKEARRWYQMHTDTDVEQVGFLMSDDGRFGASPDGLVASEGGLELKCPLLETHIGYLDNPDALLTTYRWQVHGALLVSGRQWWDLVSYAVGVQPLVIRVTPDDDTALLSEALRGFWQMYVEILALIRLGVADGAREIEGVDLA